MTRYARAKGSKASNERLPEEATSWQVMKQQLQEKQKYTKQDKPERKTPTYYNLKQSETSEWAEFEKPREGSIHKNNVKHKKKNSDTDKSKEKDYLHILSKQSNRVRKQKSKKLTVNNTVVPGKKINVQQSGDTQDGDGKDELTVNTTVVPGKKMKGRNKKNKNIQQSGDTQDGDGKDENHPFDTSSQVTVNSSIKLQKKKGIKERHNAQDDDNHSRGIKRKKEKLKSKDKTRKAKDKSGQPYKRRKPDIEPKRMIINGKEVVVVLFDGFQVRKEDAEHLTELKKNMLEKGVSKYDVAAAIKLERRRAEKALARERKNVCFQCRKSGHVLSACPELGNSINAGTGICFKCGSTEHTHYECKVIRGQDYRHAECFICKEQGHIARQCPDNPRGLYPKGGACKVCGDVTHMKKNCPDLISKKESENITLETLSNSVDILDEELKKNKIVSSNKANGKKSVVKF